MDDLSGTKFNVYLDVDKLTCNMNPTETVAQHFDSRGWTTPQNQINAGFPYFCQPGKSAGSYTKVKDFGLLITSSIVTLDYEKWEVYGDVKVVSTLEASLDGVSFGPIKNGPSAPFVNFRYIRYNLFFDAFISTQYENQYVDFHSMIQINNVDAYLDR